MLGIHYPGRGMDIPNVNTMSYIRCITETLEDLPDCETFDDYLEKVHGSIIRQADQLMEIVKNVYMEPAPLLSMMINQTSLYPFRECLLL